jgi:hypothetical protein
MYEVKMDLERPKSVPREDGTEPNRECQESEAAKPESDLNGLVQLMRGTWVRASQLPALFCSWDLAYRCTKGGWLRPIVKRKRRTIYRLADVLACMKRIESGEFPLPRRDKAAQ